MRIKIYKIEKFNSIFSTNEDLIKKGKFKIVCLRAELDFFQGLIEIIKGLIAKKKIEVNSGFN